MVEDGRLELRRGLGTRDGTARVVGKVREPGGARAKPLKQEKIRNPM